MNSRTATRLALAWLAVGLIVQLVFYGLASPFNPMLWAHVILWPLFLLLAAVSLAIKAIVFTLVALAVGWLLLRARKAPRGA